MDKHEWRIKAGYDSKFIERFFKYVRLPIDGSTECWEWTGGFYVTGYGKIWHQESNIQRRAHRVSWEILYAKSIPDGMFACHTCDHPWCVNPYHIFIASHTDNVRDCVTKKRHSESKKTHCKHGHPFSGENLIMRVRKRFCRICQQQKWARNNHRKRGMPTAIAVHAAKGGGA